MNLNRFKTIFRERGYTHVSAENGRMELFYVLSETGVDAVLLADLTEDFIMPEEQYLGILNQFRLFLYKKHSEVVQEIRQAAADSMDEPAADRRGSIYTDRSTEIRILNLIFCEFPYKLTGLTAQLTNYWIADTINCRLMIYENQQSDFMELRRVIEDEIHRGRRAGTAPWSVIKDYLSPVSIATIAINIAMFIYSKIESGSSDALTLMDGWSLSWYSICHEGEYYRILTYMFLHAGVSHLFNNMLTLAFVGSMLERIIGGRKWLLTYMISGIMAGLASVGYNYISYATGSAENLAVASVGASGAIFGIVGALAYIVIRNKGKVENVSRRQIVLYVAFSLYGGFTSEGIDNAAHVGGLIAGAILAFLLTGFRRWRKS